MSVSSRFEIGSLSLAYAAAGVFWGTLVVALPALQARADLSDGALGLALGIMALAAFPVMRVFGQWLDRIEPWAIPGAMAGFALGTLALVFLPDVAGLLVAFSIVGGASGALDIALNNRTARVERETGVRLFNITHAIFPAAMLVASFLTGWARDVGVTTGGLFTVVTLCLCASAVLERWAGGHVVPVARKAPPSRAPLNGALLLLAVIAAAGAFQEAAANSWTAIFVEVVQNGSPFQAGFAAAAFTLGLSLGRVGAHLIEDYLRSTVIVRLAALVAASGFAMAAMNPPVAITVVAILMAGIGVGPIEPAVFRAVALRDDDLSNGPALAIVTTIAYLGYLFSPPVLGLAADAFGFAALWSIVVFVALAVTGMAARVART